MRHFVYVPITDERRLLTFALAPESGMLTLRHELDLASHPWQLGVDPMQRYLYQQLRDDGYSSVASFRIDPETGSIQQIGEVELEDDAVYLATDRTGRFLFAAYLVAGLVTVHAIGEGGAVRESAVVRWETKALPHAILTDPSNRYVFVPHVHPTNTIEQFLFDEHTGNLTPNAMGEVETASGHGPRHVAFHPRLNILYFNEEQVSRVAAYRLDPAHGTLELLQSISTLPQDGFSDKTSTGSVRIHPSGQALYVSNRGHDSIAMFAVNPISGCLSPMGHVPSQPIPRTIGIDPDGRFFFAGSDTTNQLATYRINVRGVLEMLKVYDVGMWVGWIMALKFG